MSITDNPISITLGPDESTTVPTGETWSVTIQLGGSNDITGASVNNRQVARVVSEATREAYSFETVLTSGDEIGESEGGGGIHIGGFSI